MKANLHTLIYNNKSDLGCFNMQAQLNNVDLVLLHHTYATSKLSKEFNKLTKGILNPKDINTSYPNAFLAQLQGCNLPIAIATPLVDNMSHSPYYNIMERIEDTEVTISQNFLDAEHYNNYELFERIFQLYQFSFQYVFTYLEEQVLQRTFLQEIGAWEQSSRPVINALVIGNHNFLSHRLITSKQSDINTTRTTLTKPFVSLSIRHEIMRRKLLGLDVLPEHYNGYTIERSIKVLQNEITIPPHRTLAYPSRVNMCNLSDEETLQLSQTIYQQKSAIDKLEYLTRL